MEDLDAAVAEAIASPEKFNKGAAAIYGLAATVPCEVVSTLAHGYMDALYVV